MANITVTLLTSKRTRQTIDALDNTVLTQAGGYTIVEGENKATKIKVNYPEEYASWSRYVYMKNAKGEHDFYYFEPGESEFDFPGSMAYRGNTVLVFYAVNGDVTVPWLPVIVPIAATGIDYAKVATASEDFLKQVLSQASEASSICKRIEERAESGEFNGESAFIRYAYSSDGHDMTESWSAGQKYLGVYIGTAAPTDYREYRWILFVGGDYCEESTASGNVSIILMDTTDKTFLSNGLTSVYITVPSSANHGFYAGLNFKSGETSPTVNITNAANFPLKLIINGAPATNYVPSPGVTVQCLFYCDGLNVYGYINEV